MSLIARLFCYFSLYVVLCAALRRCGGVDGGQTGCAILLDVFSPPAYRHPWSKAIASIPGGCSVRLPQRRHSVGSVSGTERSISSVTLQANAASEKGSRTGSAPDSIEVKVAVDSSLFKLFDSSHLAVRDHVQAVMLKVDEIFRQVSISIHLADLEIWDSGSPVDLPNASSLSGLIQYHHRWCAVQKSSNKASLDGFVVLTAEDLNLGNGMATFGTVGTGNAVAIVQDYLQSLEATAALISHELAHMLGVGHDENNDETCDCSDRLNGCIMSAVAVGTPRKWSQCSAAAMHRLRTAGATGPRLERATRFVPGNESTSQYMLQLAVNGTWGNWGQWSPCPHTCGSSDRYRLRQCVPPPTVPSTSLVDCPGNNFQVMPCNAPPCSAPGTEWSQWSGCPVRCGGGFRRRQRSCPPTAVAVECINGVQHHQMPCNQRPCQRAGKPGWSIWGVWSPCSTSCGPGRINRQRWCNTPSQPETCRGVTKQTQQCNKQPCGVLWSAWSQWTKCDISCGDGSRMRRRQCSVTNKCLGSALETTACNAMPGCRSGTNAVAASATPNWALWSQWVGCSQENCQLPSSVQTRKRKCTGIPTACNGPSIQRQQCRCELLPTAHRFFEDQRLRDNRRNDSNRLMRIVAIVTGSIFGVALISIITCCACYFSKKKAAQSAMSSSSSRKHVPKPAAPLHNRMPAPPPYRGNPNAPPWVSHAPPPHRQPEGNVPARLPANSASPQPPAGYVPHGDYPKGHAPTNPVRGADGMPYTHVPQPLMTQLSSLMTHLNVQQRQQLHQQQQLQQMQQEQQRQQKHQQQQEKQRQRLQQLQQQQRQRQELQQLQQQQKQLQQLQQLQLQNSKRNPPTPAMPSYDAYRTYAAATARRSRRRSSRPSRRKSRRSCRENPQLQDLRRSQRKRASCSCSTNYHSSSQYRSRSRSTRQRRRKPASQRNYAKSVSQRAYGKPLYQRSHPNPVYQRSHPNLVYQRSHPNPVRQKSHPAPVYERSYTNPVSQRPYPKSVPPRSSARQNANGHVRPPLPKPRRRKSLPSSRSVCPFRCPQPCRHMMAVHDRVYENHCAT